MVFPGLLIVALLVMLILLINKRQMDDIMKLDIVLYVFQLVLHFRLILMDPGVLQISNNIQKKNNNDRYCDKCKIYAKNEDDLYHCIICGICVSHSDHHCAWVAKCIGRNNYVYHNMFIVCVLIYINLTLILLFL